jgi:hypothetical protein
MSMKHEIAGLERMTVSQLQARYAEVFGEPARSGNRQWLFRRVAWRIQALAEGDLSERARERARELARDADLRVKPPKDGEDAALHPQPQPVGPLRTVSGKLSLKRDPRVPVPGTKLTKTFKGHEYRVIVLPHGFEYDGQVFKSLSAVAHAITGSHWNGLRFFNLGERENAE